MMSVWQSLSNCALPACNPTVHTLGPVSFGSDRPVFVLSGNAIYSVQALLRHSSAVSLLLSGSIFFLQQSAHSGSLGFKAAKIMYLVRSLIIFISTLWDNPPGVPRTTVIIFPVYHLSLNFWQSN
jgi:hypothetical protein